jgi:ATP-dependent Clp protease ATP-binding subunit ClpA
MGARPLARLIQEEVKRALADELLFGKLLDGGVVDIGVKHDQLDFQIRSE